MKVVNSGILECGDIILTTSIQKVSSVIRAVTNSDISHAMICLSKGSIVDSTSEGVQARNIEKMLFNDESEIYILRSKTPLTDNQTNNIETYVRSIIGTSYSMREAAASALPLLSKKTTRKQFCSRMVARAYSFSGIELVDNPDYCTPEDIKKSDKLKIIEPASINISDDEVVELSSIEDTTQLMRDATRTLLTAIRRIDKRVEEVNDIDNLIIMRPSLDKKITKALIKSNYIEYSKKDPSRFPWRYDPLSMIQFYHAAEEQNEGELVINYCRRTIEEDNNGNFSHWKTMLEHYSRLSSKYNFEYFRMMTNLYLNLNFNHHMRIQSANALLTITNNKLINPSKNTN
ncbi:hypothetical protein K3H40_10205 [Aeromonas veronii]|uniref:YiiX/YebB-like N1pC/P60 family cysteine hydrolase n=1 Tax=Aeromonas veronii TaxID=654 RepID=UPI001F2F3238|nr:YiiX/YebB-like N1pC/P60 family cysteine hydrolase [Aeromonas veronii]MCF5879450.1 hypothetical protein [Aeromonas veronii]